MRQKPEKTAAILTIKNSPKLTKRGRQAIAAWLREHATLLEQHGDKYAPSFRGRYLYRWL